MMRTNGLAVTLALAVLTAAGSQPALAKLPRQRTVAITVDDLPLADAEELVGGRSPKDQALSVNRALLRAFKRHGAPVTGFVVQSWVDVEGDAGASILRSWIDQGFDLGNHTFSHPDFNVLDVAAEEEEVVKGERAFLPLMRGAGRKTLFFRFPLNHSGDTTVKHEALQAFLARRGYRLAVCTIDNEDFVFSRAYDAARASHDSHLMARVKAAYLAYTATEIDYYAGLGSKLFGDEPPEVMLLHANRLNADAIDDVLRLFEIRNYRFVTLTKAEGDPAYAVPDTLATPYGMMWGYRWAREIKVKVDGRMEAEPPEWIVKAADAAAPR